MPGGLYAQPLSLLTDLYQITMAAAAWKAGVDEREAVFHLVFRKAPFHSGFTVAAGLGPALELLRELKLGEDDLRWAEAHKVIIDRFGRFPHRNAILGRTSTPEEIEFLRGPDSSF